MKNQEKIFKNIYKNLLNNGKIVCPRGEKTLEIENFSCEFPPHVRFVNFNTRNLKLNYIKKEFLWYIKGDKYDTSICQYAQMWNNFINEDGSINSNYGQYIYGELNQFNNVYELLKKDKFSRRASIIILQPYHLLNNKMKEVPCTYCISFRIRKNKLNMSVRMRSQDSYFGFASDIPIFSFIHEMMFIKLKDIYPNLKYGTYHHAVDSFHIYKKHFKWIKNLFNKTTYYSKIKCPKILNSKEVDYILANNFNGNIPDNFLFTKWLLDNSSN